MRGSACQLRGYSSMEAKVRGRIFKRCLRRPCRSRYREGDRCCPNCGAREHTWYYVVDLGREGGRRPRRTRGGFATRKEAETALTEVLVERQQGRHVDRSRITVAEFLADQWLDAMAMSIAGTTLEGYRGLIERYILPRIGGVVLQELTPPTINWLYADVRKGGRARGAGPLSLKTIREVHVVLHRALQDASAGTTSPATRRAGLTLHPLPPRRTSARRRSRPGPRPRWSGSHKGTATTPSSRSGSSRHRRA